MECNGDTRFPCHCNECKKRTGSAFGVSAVITADDIASFTGNTRTFARIGDSGREIRYEFCPDCGTTVRWKVATVEGIAGDSFVFACGAFDDWEGLIPSGEMYADYRVPWINLGYSLSCGEAPSDEFRNVLVEKYREPG